MGAQLSGAPASVTNGWFGGQYDGVGQQSLVLQATLDLVRAGPVALRYVASLDPLVRLTGVERYTRLGSDAVPLYVLGGQQNAWGAALVPFGLALDARLHSRLRLHAASGLGIAAFTRHVPSAAARQRNFVAQLETSALVRLDATRWLEAGVRWRHLSNGNTAWENPGIDSRLVVLGLRWQRASRR